MLLLYAVIEVLLIPQQFGGFEVQAEQIIYSGPENLKTRDLVYKSPCLHV
jgi:hypothetical protein